jgi:putative PIN family toxin of toxin-antitoxin system
MIPFRPAVVIDTNVLVSALIVAGSLPARIINLVKNRTVQTRYCDAILAEYTAVLSRPKFKFRTEDIRNLVSGIVRAGFPVNAVPSTFPMPDESDRKFYDVAKSCGAILITGNTRHYPDEPFILTPDGFIVCEGVNPP